MLVKNGFFAGKRSNGVSRWLWLFFIAACVAFASTYCATALDYPFPGTCERDMASATGLVQLSDFSSPIYHYVAHIAAKLSFGVLAHRLNIFNAICAGVSMGLLFLFLVRLAYRMASETATGSMRVFFPPDEDDGDIQPTDEEETGIPEAVALHNRFAAGSAFFGALAGTLAFAFSTPFWFAATRLHPFPFDLLAFLAIANLALDYEHSGREVSFFACAFLSALFSMETPFLLLTFPIALVFLLRSLAWQKKNSASPQVAGACVVAGIGLFCAWMIIWKCGANCELFENTGRKALFSAAFASIGHSMRHILPNAQNWYWNVLAITLSLPGLAMLFLGVFTKRTWSAFFCGLPLAAVAIANILPTQFSLWETSRDAIDLPLRSYLLLCFALSLLAAQWHLMRENRFFASRDRGKPLAAAEDEFGDDTPEIYEHVDNRIVCFLGQVLCWLFPIAAIVAPFFNWRDVTPETASFTEGLYGDICAEVADGDWIFDLQTSRAAVALMLAKEGKKAAMVSTGGELADRIELAKEVARNSLFDETRVQMQTAANISLSAFLGDWLEKDPKACDRFLLRRKYDKLLETGLSFVPNGLFFKCLPSWEKKDAMELLARQRTFMEKMTPFLFTETIDRLPIIAELRKSFARQLAVIGNELGCMLSAQGKDAEAEKLFAQLQRLDPRNYAVLFNRYDLVFNRLKLQEERPAIEDRIREVAQEVDAFSSDESKMFPHLGTLISPSIVSVLRNRYWIKQGQFYKFMSAKERSENEKLVTSTENKKKELRNIVLQKLDRNELDDATKALDTLASLESGGEFILMNRARVAIQLGDAFEAERLVAEVKATGVAEEKLIWHEASILYLREKQAEAKAMLNNVLPDHVTDARLWGLLGEILLKEERYDEVEKRVLPALRHASGSNGHYLLHVVKGALSQKDGKLVEARAAYRKALEMNQYLDDIRDRVLKIDDALDIPSFSEQDAKECLRRNPGNAKANYLLGMANYHNGNMQFAKALFMRSLDAEPLASAEAGLGAVFLEQKRYAEAGERLASSWRKSPGSLFTANGLVDLLLAKGQVEQAKKLFERCGDESLASQQMSKKTLAKFIQLKLLVADHLYEKAYHAMIELRPLAVHLPNHERKQLEAFCADFEKKLEK